MMSQSQKDRTRYRILFWAALAVTLIGLAPVISALLSAATASVFDCEVNAAHADPCMVMGADISDALYFGFMSLVLMLFTAPVILAAVVLWIVFAVFRVRASKAAQTPSPVQDRKTA